MTGLAAEVQSLSPPLEEWRRFVYCRSMSGQLLGQVDHFEGQSRCHARSLKFCPLIAMTTCGHILMSLHVCRPLGPQQSRRLSRVHHTPPSESPPALAHAAGARRAEAHPPAYGPHCHGVGDGRHLCCRGGERHVPSLRIGASRCCIGHAESHELYCMFALLQV